MRDRSVRVAIPADQNGIEAVLAASYATLLRGHYAQAILDAALPIITRASPVLLSSGRFHVATDASGTILACGGWSEARPGTDTSTPGRGHIRHFATDPSACRLGLGRAICAACVEQAREIRIDVFECWSSLAAVPFYASLGFRTEGPMDVRFPSGVLFPAIVMTRSMMTKGRTPDSPT